MARRKKEIPQNGLETIRRLAERGVRETEICKAFGMSYRTFQRIKDENEEVRETLEEARMIEERQLFDVLFEKAILGDSTCAMFLLKTRHGYQEGAQVVNPTQVNVQITLPGALKPKEYIEKLIHDGKT